MSRLLLLGVSHHSAPVELRERLDLTDRGLESALETLAERHGVQEAVVLSTCNRAEVYTTCTDVQRARSDVARFLTTYNDVPADVLAPHLYHHVDDHAARHLFRVAAGLDSQVIGEPQILGQVKDAYARAADQDYTDSVLNRVFHAAFTTGKRVRAETGLGEGAVSVSFAAVALAQKIFGSLEGLSVLLVGAGEMGTLTAQHLRAKAIGRVAIASRTAARAEALAARLDGAAVPWSDLPAELERADIVVTTTGASKPILDRDGVANAMRHRRFRPLFIIDIAVPRDVDPAAAELEQVFLYDIDDLTATVDENLSRRASEVARAEAIVAEELERFLEWHRGRGAVPTVVALRRRFETVRRAELDRLRPKIASLSPEAQARVDEITRLIVEKLLHTPTEQLKALPDHHLVQAYSDTLTRLFALGEPASTVPPDDTEGSESS